MISPIDDGEKVHDSGRIAFQRLTATSSSFTFDKSCMARCAKLHKRLRYSPPTCVHLHKRSPEAVSFWSIILIIGPWQ